MLTSAAWLAMLAFASTGGRREALAVGLNYVDATDSTNLTPTSAIDPLGSTAEPDNLWDIRADFGLGFSVYQAIAENAPQLTQKITGLVPGKSYDVYGVFATDDDENWALRAGVTAGNLTAYSFWGNRGPFPTADTIQAVTAGAAVWDTLPPANKENTYFTERPADTLVLLLGKAGTIAANASGEIDVLLDDLPNLAPNTGPRRTWLEGVAYTDANTQISLNATLDRTTGALTITNPTGTPFQFKSYSLVSVAAGLDATAWTTIPGWTTTATPDPSAQFATDLTQTDPIMNGTTISAGGGVLSFGNVWNPSRFEDVLIRLTRTDNEIAVIVPQYTGPQIVAGDFNASGTINLADFQILLSSLHSSLPPPNQIVASQQGDMNGDLAVNFADFAAFRSAYDVQNGAGAFAQLAESVPEPASLVIVAMCIAGLSCYYRRRIGRAVWLLTPFCLATCISGSALALNIKVDLDSTRISGTDDSGPIVTQSGFTSWDLTEVLTAGSTITVNGVMFEIFGLNAANQSRVRLAGGIPNGGGGAENDLLADFVFNEGADGRAVGLRISGLPVGTYAMQSWHNDFGVTAAEATQIEVRNQGQAADPSHVLLAPRPWSISPIEFPLEISTPGQVREVIFREGSGTNRARLNAFTISDEVPPAPIVELTLQVNSTTGAVRIVNEQSSPFDMSYYEIRSTTGSLNVAGWMSLDDAEGGDPVGTGWDEALNSGASILSEVNLQSMRSFAPGNSVSLGNAFTVGSTQNLAFRYAGPNETALRVGIVEYITGPGSIIGDYNGNGTVDAADYIVWRKNLGTSNALPNDSTPGMVTSEDYNAWRANFGKNAPVGAGLASEAAVPEPNMLPLSLSAMMFLLRMRQTREIPPF
jgi:hypothetical protein